jgi:hypothetical protein
MKRLALLPLIVLTLAACSDTTTTSPLSVPRSLPGPQSLLTIEPTNAPQGTHFQTGTASCQFDSILLKVICAAYELGGVGNTNATADLALTFTATINCTNRGGELVEVHSQDASATVSSGTLRSKNGRLDVTELIGIAPTNPDVLKQADCPNHNWTPSVQAGSLTLTGFTYTLTFAGFSDPFITITGP